jgi:hypothetical protein
MPSSSSRARAGQRELKRNHLALSILGTEHWEKEHEGDFGG